ncbi:glycoside hydrolase family 16 protein [Deinococcus peraridilitoris]|uniref:Beta-glucanase/beta-glucan synthetase n=1 Tax=Deinococcus peraridilitoris (strain DSM 19664 / LMG 22246 / CIP 109416 / KR-200) TaxID=937777 RepID=L0A5B8_DEIPD|nr:glycoside hydrolase family 16 protein [Deinococcus peraridilitoris]AFZ68377.1 beta-glucanase/beta-glucan synthetase [Deinococcus peraridilitoris DSM 19664]
MLKLKFRRPLGRSLLLSLLAGNVFAQTALPDLGPVPPGAARPGWELTWHDEFSAPYGSPVDTSKWNFETGGWGWGNGERQYYTDTKRNAIMDGSGRLVITARAENENTPLICGAGLRCQYSSARLNTKGKFEQQYGRIEARIKVAAGQGLWSAFWMLGARFPEVRWPNSGEIDIVEQIGREPNKVHGTIHGPFHSAAEGITGSTTLPRPLAEDFHVYAVEWSENEIRWFVDDVLFQTLTPANLPEGAQWVYNQPFFVILNLAVGGGFSGYPNASTKFPQQMLVDYVRAYRRSAP